MPWSHRSQWIVVVVAVVLAVAVALVLHHREPPADPGHSQWRAESGMLVQRVEQLSSAGEVDAAASVLEVLAQRPDLAASGQDDRARMALARAYLTAGRRDQALKQVQAIPWADKEPQIAAEIVGLELAVRWRGLFDDQGELISGAVTPRNSFEATFGRPAGLWHDRWEEYRALATALDRGARMVAAEGGQVTMPAGAGLLRLARYSRGDGTQAALLSALGDPQRWDADLALAVERLLLSEYDPEAALTAAEVLWSRHASSTQAGLALRDLRLWQGRRQTLADTVKLWAFPAVDGRIEAASRQYPTLAASADAALQQERELNRTAMDSAVTRIVSEKKPDQDIMDGVSELSVVAGAEETREWRLALTYDGLRVQPDHQEIAAGQPAGFQITSKHRGEHRLRLYRLPGR
ncbi:MAG TPA: hypothetical protein VHX44_09965, partial [Planctomycetota bacterium]|nr:hypothetical protein [Planctomycetota bacterium]